MNETFSVGEYLQLIVWILHTSWSNLSIADSLSAGLHWHAMYLAEKIIKTIDEQQPCPNGV